MWPVLESGGADTVIVITDSVPSGARHVDPSLVRESSGKLNRFSQVVLEALLIHPAAAVVEQWKQRCAPSRRRVAVAEL
jgi:hypothetical protein